MNRTAAQQVATEVTELAAQWGYNTQDLAKALAHADLVHAAKKRQERQAEQAKRAERRAEKEMRTHRGAGEPAVCGECFMAHRGDCF